MDKEDVVVIILEDPVDLVGVADITLAQIL
jgi:hypothetical protein